MEEKPGGWSRGKKGGGGGDGKRRKGEKVGQFIHVCAAQTVDNGTEVDGRPTAPLMEQMKCGLTTCWLSHGMAAYKGDALKALKLSFSNTSLIWHLSAWWQKDSVFGHFWKTKAFHAKCAWVHAHIFSHTRWYWPPLARMFGLDYVCWPRFCIFLKRAWSLSPKIPQIY